MSRDQETALKVMRLAKAILAVIYVLLACALLISLLSIPSEASLLDKTLILLVAAFILYLIYVFNLGMATRAIRKIGQTLGSTKAENSRNDEPNPNGKVK
jgi:hypothetical protein